VLNFYVKKRQDSPSGKFLNFEFIKEENEIFFFQTVFPPETASPLNLVQCWMIDPALDESTSMTANIAFKEKKLPLATDHHVLFHRPMPLGEATMQTKIIKYGKTVTTIEGKLFDQNKKLVATMLHTALPKIYQIINLLSN
tara:strand:- start:251 stop:673 length:423 start_codon:yes stop_codon:yes gene_type:complete